MFLKKFVYVNWGNIPATDFAKFRGRPINLDGSEVALQIEEAISYVS